MLHKWKLSVPTFSLPKNLIPALVVKKKQLVLLFTLLAGCGILAPYIFFQGYLSQGDHGRELYCFEQVGLGAVPYRDLFWNYGPLSLYYYAFWFKLAGVSINSVLLGRAVLNLVSGFLIFGSLALFVPLMFAALGAVWFWFFNPDFHFTYCYTPGITALLLVAHSLLRYIKTGRVACLYLALLGVFLLALIKINFGITSLLGTVIVVGIWDVVNKSPFNGGKKLFWLAASIGVPLAVLFVYFLLVKDLSMREVYQCFPFLPGRPQGTASTMGFSVFSGLAWWLQSQFRNIIQSTNSQILAFLLWLSIVLTAVWWRKGNDREQKTAAAAALFVLAVFYFLSLHEFLLSGIPYRTAWAQPFGFLIMLFFIGLGLRQVNKAARILLVLAMGLFVLTTHITYMKQLGVFKNAGKYFDSARGKLIVANERQWIETVSGATQYLRQHLNADETFYALPYDPLYYFLLGRTAPSRLYSLYVFFDRVEPAQEEEIIAALEAKKVNYVLISNRRENGVFGVDFCPRLFSYIQRNFAEVASFGDWNAASGWVDNHAVKIFRRGK